MSLLRKLKELESSIRAKPHRRSGVNLTRSDNHAFARVLVGQAAIMYDILHEVPSNARWRSIRSWAIQLQDVDLQDLARALSDWEGYFRHADRVPTVSYGAFKRHWQKKYPFVGIFFGPLREVLERFLRSRSGTDLRTILQCVAYMSRLSLKGIDLTAECLSSYMETEARIAQWRYPDKPVKALNAIMREWLRGLRMQDLVGNHGPGGVAGLGKTSKTRKYLAAAQDQLLSYCGVTPDQTNPWGQIAPLDRACEIVFVPKSVKTFRTISMEPPSLMFLQQGVRRLVQDHLAVTPLRGTKGGLIPLDYQEQNQLLAAEGSINGSYSTIDLSAASDSVSWTLVRALFAGTPVLRWLFATRSRYAILPDGKRLTLAKYAPMGSALCFLIESMVFACVCELAKRESPWTGPGGIPFSVYGDDIVCQSYLADDVARLLGRLGFELNDSKSFTDPGPGFRESCGGEYYRGTAVEPLRISRFFHKTVPSRSNPSVLPNSVEHINALFTRGFMTARKFWLSDLLESFPKGKGPMFAYPGCDGLKVWSYYPTNYHLPTRFHEDWQVTQHNASVVVAREDKEHSLQHADQVCGYFECLRLFDCATGAGEPWWYDDSLPDQGSVAGVGLQRPRLTQRWV